MSAIKKILVYRIGSLGDNLVAIPAIRAAKKYFPSAGFTLLSNQQVGTNNIPGGEVYNGAGLFDAFLTYPVELNRRGKLLLVFRLFKLILTLRRNRFDALIYLPPTARQRNAKRDKLFFRLAGIRQIFGSARLDPLPPKIPGQFLPSISHEADALLEGLRATGIPVPSEGQGDMDLGLGDGEEKGLAEALKPMAGDGGRIWVGVGPGSKQPAKVWPEERFQQVVERLIREHDVWPIVLSGDEDRELGDRLVKAWGRGYNLAGKLSVRASALALKRCALYLGNDTGTMHLAAAVKTPCVGVFCSHAYPGQWYPYGPGHRVFRTSIDCEGCKLVVCVERKMECILAIGVGEVAEACGQTLGRGAAAKKNE